MRCLSRLQTCSSLVVLAVCASSPLSADDDLKSEVQLKQEKERTRFFNRANAKNPNRVPLLIYERVWTRKDGRKIKAAVLNVDDKDTVTFRYKGKPLDYQISRLVEADQKVIQKVQKEVIEKKAVARKEAERRGLLFDLGKTAEEGTGSSKATIGKVSVAEKTDEQGFSVIQFSFQTTQSGSPSFTGSAYLWAEVRDEDGRRLMGRVKVSQPYALAKEKGQIMRTSFGMGFNLDGLLGPKLMGFHLQYRNENGVIVAMKHRNAPDLEDFIISNAKSERLPASDKLSATRDS